MVIDYDLQRKKGILTKGEYEKQETGDKSDYQRSALLSKNTLRGTATVRKMDKNI